VDLVIWVPLSRANPEKKVFFFEDESLWEEIAGQLSRFGREGRSCLGGSAATRCSWGPTAARREEKGNLGASRKRMGATEGTFQGGGSCISV